MNEIIKKYTSGEATLEETNAALKEAGAGFYLDPGKNTLTEQEIKDTTVGTRPSDVTGYGLMDSGTGTMDKVHVVDGVIQGGPVNTVNSDGVPNERDIVYIGGQTWQVYGDELGLVAEAGAPWWAPLHTFTGAVAWQDEISRYIPDRDMIRPKYRNQDVVKGSVRYMYDGDGNVKYQPKSMLEYDKDHGRV